MAHKILIALDSSEGAWRAVEYVAQTCGSTPEVYVTLLHLLAGLPPAFWDDGHVLNDRERESRERLVANWRQEQEKQWQGLVKKAFNRLTQAGIAKDGVVNKFKHKYYDVAEDILKEAEDGKFDTIVMGRRGLGMAKSVLLGSVTQKVVQTARGCAVTIVR
jgi:nucleotide-binding universal stress UspA family protein